VGILVLPASATLPPTDTSARSRPACRQTSLRFDGDPLKDMLLLMPRSMRSVPPRGSGWVSIVKVRQVIALPVQYIVNSSFNASVVPQPPPAAFVCPRAERMRPKPILPQLPGAFALRALSTSPGFLLLADTTVWT
jgi:hypothetical protein